MIAGWAVRPENAFHDVVWFDDVRMGDLFWLRELRLPAVCRVRMADGLNGVRSARARASWTAREATPGFDRAWLLLHNGVEIGELRWLPTGETIPQKTSRLVDGLNMLAGGRHPWACEPMPLSRPRHLQVVR